LVSEEEADEPLLEVVPPVPVAAQIVLPPSPPPKEHSPKIEKATIESSPTVKVVHSQDEDVEEEDLDDLLEQEEEDDDDNEEKATIQQTPITPPRVSAYPVTSSSATKISTPSNIISTQSIPGSADKPSVTTVPATIASSAKKIDDDDDIDFDDDLLEDDHSSPQHYSTAATQGKDTTENDPDEFESDEDW